jgi:hypothetical protein
MVELRQPLPTLTARRADQGFNPRALEANMRECGKSLRCGGDFRGLAMNG